MYRHHYHQHFAAPSSPVNAAIDLWALRYFWTSVFMGVFLVAWPLWIVAKWLWRNGPGWNPSQGEPGPEQGPPPAKPPAVPVRRFNWEADLFLPAKAAPAQTPPAVKPTTWEKDLFLPARETPAVPAPVRPANRVNLEIDPFAPVVYWFKGPIKRKRG